MGISEADLAFISSIGKLPHRVCDLGDQDLLCNNDAVFDSLGFNGAPRRGKSADFWKSVGSDYLALDVVGPARRFDLNRDRVPFWWRKFDLVTNCGDTEHIMDQVNCFRSIHDLTKVGGVMYHQLPIGGYTWHGMFVYSLKFFRKLANANEYEILRIHVDRSDYTIDPPANEEDPLEQARSKLNPKDASIRIALRKQIDRAFMIPLDI